MNLQGATAVVTGGSMGIGRTLAFRLAQQGVRVALVARNAAELAKSKALIQEAGGTAEFFVADLKDAQGLEKLAQEIHALWGPVDILANVAGCWHDDKETYYGTLLHETSVDKIDDALDVNLRAPVLLARLFAPGMIANRRGKIINISGQYLTRGYGHIPYYLGKLGVENFTLGLAAELGQFNIQVNCISPGIIKTESVERFFPNDAELGISPDYIADCALFLLGSEVGDKISSQIIVVQDEFIVYNLGKRLNEFMHV